MKSAGKQKCLFELRCVDLVTVLQWIREGPGCDTDALSLRPNVVLGRQL